MRRPPKLLFVVMASVYLGFSIGTLIRGDLHRAETDMAIALAFVAMGMAFYPPGRAHAED
jgi:hypothetical protein